MKVCLFTHVDGIVISCETFKECAHCLKLICTLTWLVASNFAIMMLLLG